MVFIRNINLLFLHQTIRLLLNQIVELSLSPRIVMPWSHNSYNFYWYPTPMLQIIESNERNISNVIRFILNAQFVRCTVWCNYIFFQEKFPSHGPSHAIRLIVLVQNNQQNDGRIERDLSKLRPQQKWPKTKVSQEQWNKTNVRIQVKPKLNKFHIFLHSHISPPKKYPNCWIARGRRSVYVFLFYVCDRLLSRWMVAVAISHTSQNRFH